MLDRDTLTAVRDRFAHVDACPYQGPRIFFENAGGALTLKSVVDTSGFFAADCATRPSSWSSRSCANAMAASRAVSLSPVRVC